MGARPGSAAAGNDVSAIEPALDAGTYASQQRDDYTADDVEQYFNYMGMLASEVRACSSTAEVVRGYAHSEPVCRARTTACKPCLTVRPAQVLQLTTGSA